MRKHVPLFYKVVSDIDILGRPFRTREEAREAKRERVKRGITGCKIYQVTTKEVR
jgi:hypothetical protein